MRHIVDIVKDVILSIVDEMRRKVAPVLLLLFVSIFLEEGNIYLSSYTKGGNNDPIRKNSMPY